MTRPREHGAITPALAIATIVLAVLALGGIALGTLSVNRADVQRAADAATLAALQVVEQRGLPFDAAAQSAAEAIARGNTRAGVRFQWQVADTATDVTITALTSIDVELPLLVFATGTTEVRARSVARLPQTRFDTAERRLPKLALVLDYSGSMDLPFTGGNARAIDVLEDSVAGLLNAKLDIDYGAAFFSSDVFRRIPISSGAPNAIVDVMNNFDAGGNTNTAAALAAGRDILLAAPDTGRYVLLVSDGEPNDFNAARAAAAAVWNAGVTIFTLEIRRQGSGQQLDQFMTDVAGTPGSRGDRNYHYVATSAADLVANFRKIVSTIVCKVGPLSPATPSDPNDLHVFLRQGVVERALASSQDLGADANLERYRYEPGDASVRLTAAACDAVLSGGATIVVRTERPAITE